MARTLFGIACRALAVAVLSVVILIQPVMAATEGDIFCIENNSCFYQPGCAGVEGYAGDTTPTPTPDAAAPTDAAAGVITINGPYKPKAFPSDKIDPGDAYRGHASTYGNDPATGFIDHGDVDSSGNPLKPALQGATNAQPGIAVYNRGSLGGWWKVIAPNKKAAIIQQTDIGPSTARIVDINSAAARSVFGYKQGDNFPTDQGNWRIEYVGKDKPAGAIDSASDGTGTATTSVGSQDTAAVACCPTGDTTSVTAGDGDPNGTTFPNLNPSSMANAINKYIDQVNPKSDLKGLGAEIVASSKKANINPFLIVTIAQKESGLADPGDFNVQHGHNAFGRTATSSQPSFQGARTWYKWSSGKASVDYTAPENSAPNSGGDEASFIRAVYKDSVDKGDFIALFNKYAPPGENDTATYIAQVKSWINKLVDLTNGSPGDTAVTASATATSDTSGNNVCCPPSDSPTATAASATTSSGDKPDIIDLSSVGESMGHGKMAKIDTLIIHYTQFPLVSTNGEGTGLAKFFKGDGKGYGIQFNIGRDGKIYRYFPMKDMQVTWHAVGVNSHAIGIEVNAPDGAYMMGNDPQFQSVVSTVKYLCDYYSIPCSSPKGDITGSSAAQAQGLLGHSEAPENDHHDPDTKISYSGGHENATNIETGKPWQDSDRKDSSVHAYMKKLRTALGYNPTPGKSGSSQTATTASVASGSDNKCASASRDAPPANDTNLKTTNSIKKPGKFITLPAHYSCPGYKTVIDSRIAADVAYLVTTYNMCVEDGLANGHKSHGAGLAVDLRPRGDNSSKPAWKNSTEAAARAMGWFGDGADDPKGSKAGCAKYAPGAYGQCMHVVYLDKIPQWVRWIGYNGDVDHGDPWHIYGTAGAHLHVGWDTPNNDGVSPGIISHPRESVYAFPAPVPDDLKQLVDN